MELIRKYFLKTLVFAVSLTGLIAAAGEYRLLVDGFSGSLTGGRRAHIVVSISSPLSKSEMERLLCTIIDDTGIMEIRPSGFTLSIYENIDKVYWAPTGIQSKELAQQEEQHLLSYYWHRELGKEIVVSSRLASNWDTSEQEIPYAFSCGK